MNQSTRILLIDFNEENRTSLRKILRDHHCHAFEVTEMDQFWSSLKSETKLDIIITSLKIPHLSGHEYIKKIKELSPRTSIIILTEKKRLDAFAECAK